MMNSNQIMQQVAMMMQQSGGNPQAYVQELSRRNPQFAQAIQRARTSSKWQRRLSNRWG